MYPPPSSTRFDGNDEDTVHIHADAPTEIVIQGHSPHYLSMPQVSRTGPVSRFQTHLLGVEGPPTPEASPEPTIYSPLTPYQPSSSSFNGLLSPLDHTTNPALRRQFLSSVIASCNPQELLFMSEIIAPLLKRDFLHDLPVELVLHIISFIDEPSDLVRASRVCKNWYRVARDEGIWKRMCYLFGFDDCEEVKYEYELEEARRRREKGKQVQLDPPSGDDDDDDDKNVVGEEISIDEKESEKQRARGKGKKRNHRHHHHHDHHDHDHHHGRKFSFRRYFKTSYITRSNWRTGGTLLKSHKLPIVPPDPGTVTSLALDSESVVVGFANSMIKIFSARTGVLCRTLVGHKSGVWCVCLVNKGGHRDREPGHGEEDSEQQSPSLPRSPQVKRASARENGSKRPKSTKAPKLSEELQGSPKHSKGSSSSRHEDTRRRRTSTSISLSDGLSNLNLRSEDDVTSPISLQSPQQASSSRASSARTLPTLDLRERKGVNKILPFQSQEHLISPSMKIILGIDPHDSDASNSSSSGSTCSNSSSDEVEFPVETNGQGRHRRRRRRGDPHAEHPHSSRSSHRHESFHTKYQDKPSNDSRRMTACAPGTSRGWGQPNPIIVSGGCDKTVRVWDAVSGQCIYILHGHTSTIRAMRVLHNRPIAVTGSRDSTVRIWDIQLGRCLRVLEGHLLSVRCLDVHGNRVVSGSYDNTCRLWDIDTGECLHVLTGHYHQVYTVAFDGLRIASGGLDTTVRVWDAETGHCVALLQGHSALVCEIHLSPTILATGGSDGRVITFSLDTYEVLYRLVPHESSVTSLQLDDTYLVTGGNDGRVKLYEKETGIFVRDLTDVSDNVWKVTFTKETCAIMCRRGSKTVVEIWSLSPKYTKKKREARRLGDGAATTTS